MAVCMKRIQMEAAISEPTLITYAGRLDPMAEGLVIFLVGEMRFKKEQYLKLDKEYHTQFFLGVETDTYDVLGIIRSVKVGGFRVDIGQVSKQISQFQTLGTFEQAFPPFSSRKILGKPLFKYAREQIHDVPLEKHRVTLSHVSLIKIQNQDTESLISEIITDIFRVDGDFRQISIEQSWLNYRKEIPNQVTLFNVILRVSSGFYVRQWVHDLGNYLKTGAVTVSIQRTKIGYFDITMLKGKTFRIFSLNELE